MFILIVIAVFGCFYGLTNLIIKNKSTETAINEESEAIIQYEEIIVGDMYNQKEESYYVLVEMMDDADISTYESKKEEYMALENSLKVYTIDLSSAFNKKYVGEESNFESKYPIFSQSALLKITSGEIVEKYEGQEEIINYFDSINEVQE